MIQDLRFAMRMMTNRPGFTAVAVLTLALGIGANTVVFSLVHKILIAYLPVERPEQLVVLSQTNLEQSGVKTFAYPFYRELAATEGVFDGVICRGGGERVTVGTEAGGEPAMGELVSGNYFDVLGVKPHIGRLLTQSDDITPGAHPVVVLSYRYWQRRFGADPSVVGTTVLLTGYPFTVVGVSPPGFDGIDPGQTTDLRVPLAMQMELRWGPTADEGSTPPPLGLNQRQARELNIVGRLKPGVSLEQAEQMVSARFRRYLDAGEPVSEPGKRLRDSERIELAVAATGFGKTRQQFQMALRVLMTITFAVLAIACLNLANLQLARSSTRGREFALRLALGAGPGRLARQVITESVLLSLCGATLGAIIAYPGSALLLKLMSGSELGLDLDARPSATVFLFHFAIALICGGLFGLAPALSARKQSLIPGLKGSVKTAAKMNGRKLLVVAQVALSFVVLVGAGLFLRTVYALQTADLGFRPDHLLMVALSPKNSGRSDAEVLPFFRAVQDRVAHLPGAESATFAQVRVMSGNTWSTPVAVEGFVSSDPGQQPSRNVVGPNYFRTLAMPLIAGRDFTAADDRAAPKVAIVNESFARYYFPQQDALGKKIGIARPEFTIVGVARDGKYSHVREATPRFWYVPVEQQPNIKYLDLVVRTSVDPESMIKAVGSAIASVDKSVALFNVRSQQAQIDELLRVERMMGTLATVFGAMAAALAALGLYGVLSFMAAQRRHEIGIRLALGAEHTDILRMILGRGVQLTIVGVVIGLLVAIALTRLIASMLFGVGASDPLTLVLVSSLLIVISLLACYLPARRATKVDPLEALRYE
jgi:predicted permease